AADDIVVGLVNSQVVLSLDTAGTRITDLNTTYTAATGVLTITAATAGTISTAAPISGVTVDAAADTIAVNLKILPTFAGIVVKGNVGADLVTIGPGGVNLAAVSRGGASQGFSIDTGDGVTDTIAIDHAVSAKGAGAVSLTTVGQANGHGISLSAPVTTSRGPQSFDGAVTLANAPVLTAGGAVTFSSLVIGDSGLTIAKATSVAFNGQLVLDARRDGSVAGASGLTIGRNVNNVVVSGVGSAIAGFDGSGIRFLGGSRGSRITNVSLMSNGSGIQIDPGLYTGTVIAGNAIFSNVADGVVMKAARGIKIGANGADAANTIVFNGGYGIVATGSSSQSTLGTNQISNNVAGTIANLGLRRWTWFVRQGAVTGVSSAPGLAVTMDEVGRAALAVRQLGRYTFDIAFDVNGVQVASGGRIDTGRGLLATSTLVDSEITEAQNTEFRQVRGVTYVDAQSLGATGTPWVSVSGSSDAAVATNSLVGALTPRTTLASLEFPIGAQFVSDDPGLGKRYQATIGAST
ncbi:MAG: right-handed parallel beta-helix repeat-containing protein, partial [Actinobacteria bacterium]|nr:right-handed parallel beta-helix repeat-containing protein [Actinomycetota bacterium]